MSIIDKSKKYFTIPTSLVAKISLGFGLIGMLFLVNLINTMVDANKTEEGLTRMADESIPVFTQMSDISSTASQLEPLILELLESTSLNQLSTFNEKINAETKALKTTLATANTRTLSATLEAAIKNDLDEIETLANDIVSAIGGIAAQQKNVINIQDLIKQDIEQLDEQRSTLDSLLSDILYELDDDYVISLIQEFRASMNEGMLYIEKLKASSSLDELEIFNVTIERWARDHKTVLQALPLRAGEDPDVYINLIRALNQTTDSIMLLVQGEYINNDYQNGLQEFKTQQVSLAQHQRQLLANFRQTLDNLLNHASLLIDIGFNDLTDSSNQIQRSLDTQRTMGYFLGGTALLLIMLISIYLTRYFKKAISIVQNDLMSLAKGELSKPKPIQGTDEFSKINESVGQLSNSLRDIVGGIGDANTNINKSVELVSSQASDTLEFVAGQKQELDMVATALTEMAATASEVASHASSTHEKITTAGELSKTGRENVTSSKNMIDQVSLQSTEAKAVIDSLNVGVQSIATILTTIGSISEQTNLLALNAAIEAARAGEQGRGFAVVADEVRALAGRTQASTHEIQAMTEGMLKESARAVTVMEQSGELVNRSVSSAQLADDTIAQFSIIMEEVLDLSRLIATASEEQASTVNELNNNVHQVSDLAERTHHSAESSQATSHQLRSLASDLQLKVSRFRIIP
ncbi:methyl-accepting chemotaxis protein [Reinekea sp.]|jgi:methyl-accepting chemotaxis protein|uniref:methyl-accepting chemotaxis protein n=1 Tax=Reinekea sp. TaxID=1970455 RepID=UPI0039893FC4